MPTSNGKEKKRSFTFNQFATNHDISLSFVKRAVGHGLIKVIYYGDRPHIPAEEDERIARDGLPNVPSTYRRITTGPAKGGRPRREVPKSKFATKRHRADDERRARS